MLSVVDGSKLVQNLSSRLAFKRSDHVAQIEGGGYHKKMELVDFAIDLSDFAVD
jgi:hypothetical protein